MPLAKRLRQALVHGEILVDGHNLCFRDGELAALMRRDPEKARRGLETRLRHLRRALLFYDGGPGGERRVVSRLGLRCIYSGGGIGDDEIVSWLRGRVQGKRVCVVVSDDRELRRRCEQRGALCCHCRDFLAWLEEESQVEESEPGEEPPDAAEVEYWLRQFGATDDDG